jgi:hypothetical protein
VYADVRFRASSEAAPSKLRSLAGHFLLVAFAVMLIGVFAMGTLVTWQIEKSVAEVKAASTALYYMASMMERLQVRNRMEATMIAADRLSGNGQPYSEPLAAQLFLCHLDFQGTLIQQVYP